MRGNLLIVIFLIKVTFLFSQNKVTPKSFPTNFSNSEFEKLDSIGDQIIAFDGVIKEKKISRHNTPFYLLELGKNKRIWTLILFKNDKNKINDKIRVVGYLTDIHRKDIREDETYLKNEKYIVIAMGLVDFKNENFLFVGGAKKQRKDWIKGKIPRSN